MANKPATRNWNDTQMIIATISMAMTLGFWNLFAGPDREAAAKRAEEEAAQMVAQKAVLAPQATATPLVPTQSTLQGNGTIFLGGSAPQTQIIVPASRRGKGGGGGAAASTRSS